MANTSTEDEITPFDRAALRRHRARAAAGFAEHDFLFREVAERLVERLGDVRRDFPRVLILGGHGAILRNALPPGCGAELLVECADAPASLVADEDMLPFAQSGFDLVISAMALHWVNDLPGALVQARRALKPDGLFLAAFPGGATLHELRRALMEAEAETTGGAGLRVSPFVELRDAGDLLQRAGFALPVADGETITVTYGDAFALMRDLRGMGESNAMAARRKSFSRRDTMFAAASRYGELFASEDGRIPASFEIVTLTAWAPHAAQQKPLAPGSAEASLADVLGSGDKNS
ncbi:MAG: methyltransferase domain-containing protein [Alphaproteobacteria bacterium]